MSQEATRSRRKVQEATGYCEMQLSAIEKKQTVSYRKMNELQEAA